MTADRARRRMLTRPEVEALAENIATLIEGCRSGELTGTPVMVHRLEGALTAIETVLGRSASLLDQITESDPAER